MVDKWTIDLQMGQDSQTHWKTLRTNGISVKEIGFIQLIFNLSLLCDQLDLSLLILKETRHS